MIISLKANSQNGISHVGKLTSEEREALEKKFNWENDILIINLYLPTKYHDNYGDNFLANKKNWNTFYQNLQKEDVDIKFVYSDCSNKNQRLTDEGLFFKDEENFIRNTFLSDKIACNGVIVINKEGSYLIKLNDYNLKNIISYVNELR